MKILIAPASFKGSIISKNVSNAIASGIKKLKENIEIIESPIADGGMGTSEILTEHFNGKFVICEITGPVNRKIQARYGIVFQQKLAIIELAQAAGLYLIPDHLRNPLKTTTIGVGELIKNSIKRGCKKIILGVGDSGTIDCGIGALSVLGVKFFDKDLRQIDLNCSGLLNLYRIDDTAIVSLKKTIEFIILADVFNPLTGKNGALLYAPQKGAHKNDLPLIHQCLKNFKKVIYNQYGIDLDKIKGSGAAGGIAAGMYAILGAKIFSGFDYFEKMFKISEKIRNADIVITGEGKIDRTTFSGKAVGRIIKTCKKYNKPIILACGDYNHALNLKKHGVIEIYSLVKIAKDKNKAIIYPEKYLNKIGREIATNLLVRL